MRDPGVIYTIPFANVLFAIVLCETIVVPVYVVGWDLYEPLRLKDEANNLELSPVRIHVLTSRDSLAWNTSENRKRTKHGKKYAIGCRVGAILSIDNQKPK